MGLTKNSNKREILCTNVWFFPRFGETLITLDEFLGGGGLGWYKSGEGEFSIISVLVFLTSDGIFDAKIISSSESFLDNFDDDESISIFLVDVSSSSSDSLWIIVTPGEY